MLADRAEAGKALVVVTDGLIGFGEQRPKLRVDRPLDGLGGPFRRR